MSTREQVTRAIFGQESSYGLADTSQENYAGARGPMQVTKSTFEGMKSKGMIPNDYDHANPKHSKEAGDTLVGHLFDKYGGDPRKVFAAYYAGEKAVRKDGSIADFRDLKNSSAPTTLQYVSATMRRLGVEDAPDEVVEEPQGGPRVPSDFHAKMPAKREKQAAPGKTPVSAFIADLSLPTSTKPVVGQALAEQALSQEKQALGDNTSVLDVAKAKFMHEGVGPLLKMIARPDFDDVAVPGYRPSEEVMAGMTTGERSFMLDSRSPEEQAYRMGELKIERDDQETANRRGFGANLLGSALAGLPADYLTGMGVMRAFSLAKVGAEALAAGGRRGAALTSAFAENAVAGGILGAVNMSISPYYSTQDYAMEVMGSAILGGGLHAPGLWHKSSAAIAEKELTRLHEQGAAKALALRERAIQNLEADATPEALEAEVRRLDAQDLAQTRSRATAAQPAERQLLGDVEEEAVRLEAANKSEATPTLVAPRGEIDPLTVMSADGTPAVKHTGSTRAVLELAETQAVDPLIRTLANRIRVALGDQDFPLHTVDSADIKKVSPGAQRSNFNPLQGAVHIEAKFMDGAGNIVRGKEWVAVHEAAHAATVYKLKQGALAPDSTLGKLYSEIESLRKELRTKAGTTTDFDGTVAYYLSKPSEFVAGLYSGRSAFVDFLKKTKVKNDKTAFSVFVDAVRKLLGIADGEVNAFTKALELSEKLIGEKLDVKLATKEVHQAPPASNASDILNDPVAIKHGINLLPMKSSAQQAEAKAMLSLYKKAEAANIQVDERRLSWLMNTALFSGAQSTANTMLRSKNPVVRFVAATLLESPSGAGGRGQTASIAKYMNEHAYLGNTLNDVQDVYIQYRNQLGGNVQGDIFGGRLWQTFNREVAAEIEGRMSGKTPAASSPLVKQAADRLEEAYERTRVAQRDAKTIGWASLPESSLGYMPHRMDPEKVRTMTNEQLGVLHTSLVDQFVQIEGFDFAFSDNLASKYLDRVRSRALGGFEPATGVHQVGAADIVEDALRAAGLDEAQVKAQMQRYMAGGAGHTKRRLKLDLNAEHTLADGSTFRLLDVFDTDQFNLLRNQVHRVSGEVALARQGVYGRPGLALLRRTMELGDLNSRATVEELRAFDQIAAEFLGDAFGTQSKLVDRAMQVNSLARLGGMGFQQLGEAINGIFHVGVIRTLSSIGDMGRLRAEIKALARGEAVDNPVIGPLESFGGKEFGTDAYKTVFPFDNGSLQYQTFGQDTLTNADRLLRGGSFLQAKLSFWRTIHSTQHRGMAEQIVRKAAEYIRVGKNDAALRDMGISDDLAARLRTDLGSIATWDGDRLMGFDISKATDLAAAEEFVQAVHRGTSQIIQGTFIGERGAWAHSGIMRLLTQFRTFSLTSVEKQWARQHGNVGAAKALGMLVGAMSVAAPIYMARTYVNSIGREDQQDYLDRQLSAEKIARATLNYVSMSGLAGDFLDALSATTGVGEGLGGRTGAGGKDFVGNVVAPSAALANDLYKALQDTKEGTDPHDLIKSLPFSKLPFLQPAINSLGN